MQGARIEVCAPILSLPEPRMIYLVAIFLPPLALLLYGRVFQAIFNLLICIVALVTAFVWLFFAGAPGLVIWFIAVLHAVLVINSVKQDRRARLIAASMRQSQSQQH
jgi:hypothetical protein